MKKLIVHIGYSKTGTTTMQKGLFVKLQNEGLINYLGIAYKDNNNNFRQASIIRDYLIFNQEFNTDDIYISSQKLNVLSNEFFTLSLSLFSTAEQKSLLFILFDFIYFSHIKSNYIGGLVFCTSL